MAAVYGTAAAGLRGKERWARNRAVARVGAAGEARTQRLLDELPGDVAVLHDVRVPIPGWSINVDHVVVSGLEVWLIDSKSWRPGRYVTIWGRTWRGWRRFAHADGQTLTVAARRFSSMLPAGTVLHTPVVVVHPSSPGSVAIGWYRPKGAVAVDENGLRRLVRAWGRHAHSADPAIVSRLVAHVRSLTR